MVADGPSSRGFAFRYVLPPPPLALPSLWSAANDRGLRDWGLSKSEDV